MGALCHGQLTQSDIEYEQIINDAYSSTDQSDPISHQVASTIGTNGQSPATSDMESSLSDHSDTGSSSTTYNYQQFDDSIEDEQCMYPLAAVRNPAQIKYHKLEADEIADSISINDEPTIAADFYHYQAVPHSSSPSPSLHPISITPPPSFEGNDHEYENGYAEEICVDIPVETRQPSPEIKGKFDDQSGVPPKPSSDITYAYGGQEDNEDAKEQILTSETSACEMCAQKDELIRRQHKLIINLNDLYIEVSRQNWKLLENNEVLRQKLTLVQKLANKPEQNEDAPNRKDEFNTMEWLQNDRLKWQDRAFKIYNKAEAKKVSQKNEVMSQIHNSRDITQVRNPNSENKISNGCIKKDVLIEEQSELTPILSSSPNHTLNINNSKLSKNHKKVQRKKHKIASNSRFRSQGIVHIDDDVCKGKGTANGQINGIDQLMYKMDELTNINSIQSVDQKISPANHYDLPQSSKQTLWITKSVKDRFDSSKLDIGHIENIRSYIQKLTTLQINDESKFDVGDEIAIDYDLHDQDTGELLYCIIKRIDESTNKNYKWKLQKEIYTKSELKCRKKNIVQLSSLLFKQYITSLSQNESDIDKLLNNEKKLHKRIDKAPLAKIDIYNKQHIKMNEKLEWTISIQKFRDYFKQNQPLKCIPILMSYNNINDGFQWLVIMKIESNKKCDIGISFTYNSESNKIGRITGFHLDKKAILEQHQLVMPFEHNKSCKCLDSWNENTLITHLVLGDVNQMEIDNKHLKNKLELYRKAIMLNSAISPTLNDK